MTINRAALGLIAIGFHAAVVSAQPASTDQEALGRYRAAIEAAEAGRSAQDVERAFVAFGAVRDALMRVREGKTALESLSDNEFARLRRELPGALINRDEVVFVAPDPDYFARLAAAHGDEADKEFFAALKATYPDGVWPVYVEQQTDYSGCTRFGAMRLVDAYRAWTGVQQKFPRRYAAAARTEVNAVVHELTQSTCACGDTAAVEKELQRFVDAFPQSAARPEVERRLHAVRAGTAGIREKCVSG